MAGPCPDPLQVLVLLLLLLSGTEPTVAQQGQNPRGCRGFYDLDFDFEAFERYSHFFRESSTFTLPPAGTYTGIEGIKEYIMFGTGKGLWLEKRSQPVSSIRLVGINESSGECQFKVLGVSDYTFDQHFGGGTARTTTLLKLNYKPSEHKVTDMALHFPASFLQGFFGSLNTGAVKGRICDILASNCPSTFANSSFAHRGQCIEWLDALPLFDHGPQADLSLGGGAVRNSLACRILHAALAESNDLHCPHIGRFPQKDYKGRVKCQDESPVSFVEAYFSPVDIENLEEFADLVEVDPGTFHFSECKPDPLLPLMMPVRMLLRVLSSGGHGLASSTCRTSKKITKAPFDHPSDEVFEWMSTVILWITCVISGLGVEVVVGNKMIQKLPAEEFEDFWKFSQLLFSLSLAIALLSRSVFGLPFLVFGLWKFGCPETTTYFRVAATHTRPRVERAGAFINALGTLVHHSISAWFVCCLVTGVESLDRDRLALTLPLVVQHWFVLLKYVSYGAFFGITLAVEAVWQWEALYHSIDMGHSVNTRITILIMLSAHWLYISGFVVEQQAFVPALLGVFSKRDGRKKDDDEDAERGSNVGPLSSVEPQSARDGAQQKEVQPEQGRMTTAQGMIAASKEQEEVQPVTHMTTAQGMIAASKEREEDRRLHAERR